jgi:hypothetical protein
MATFSAVPLDEVILDNGYVQSAEYRGLMNGR